MGSRLNEDTSFQKRERRRIHSHPRTWYDEHRRLVPQVQSVHSYLRSRVRGRMLSGHKLQHVRVPLGRRTRVVAREKHLERIEAEIVSRCTRLIKYVNDYEVHNGWTDLRTGGQTGAWAYERTERRTDGMTGSTELLV